MSEALVVELELKGVDKVTGGLGNVAQLTKASGTASKSQAASAAQAARALSAQISAQRQAILLQTAQVRLQQAHLRYGQMLAKQTTLKPAAGAVGAGGASSSLLGSVMSVVGMISEGAGAVLALATAAKTAADALTSFRDAMLTSGGTAGETARLGALGGAIGMNDGQMSALARHFSDAISQGGPAAGFASKAGVYDIGAFGNTDKAANLEKFIANMILDPLVSDAEAIRAARLTGTEDLLKLRDLSEGTRHDLMKDAAIRGQIFTPEQTRQAAEFNAQLNRFQGALMNVVTVVGTPVLKVVSSLMEGVADFFNLFALGLKTIFDYLAQIPILGKLFSGQEKRDNALDKNTQALRDATAAMKNGIYGGGERARGVLPGRVSGFNAHNYIGSPLANGALSL